MFSIEAGKIALNQFIQQEALSGGGDGTVEAGVMEGEITEETIVEQGEDGESHVSFTNKKSITSLQNQK